MLPLPLVEIIIKIVNICIIIITFFSLIDFYLKTNDLFAIINYVPCFFGIDFDPFDFYFMKYYLLINFKEV